MFRWKIEFWPVAVVLPLALVPTTAPSQHIGLYADEAGTQDELYPPPVNQQTSVYVLLKNAGAGLTAVSFSMPVPDCIPYTIVGVAPLSGVQIMGDLESGIDIALGGCKAGEFAMLRVDLVRTGEATPGCCTIGFAPSATSPMPGEIAGVDCSTPVPQLEVLDYCDLWVQGEMACVALMPPSDPFPAEGALGVPTNSALDCVVHHIALTTRCSVLYTETFGLFFGTDSDPPFLAAVLFPFERAELQPNTTYYWRVTHHNSNLDDPVSSPVWSFTTGDPNPASTSTWGKIKALYR